MGTQEKNRSSKPDRRAERSKRLIVQALRELTLEKGPKNITVSEIVDRADVGRATFYAHFEDKADLQRYMFGQFWAGLEEELEASMASSQPLAGRYQALVPSLALFRVVGEKHRWFRMWAASSETQLTGLKWPLIKRLEAGLQEPGGLAEIPTRLAANYLISALIALLTEWLIEDMPKTPETMDAIYQALAEPTLDLLTGS